MPIITETPTMSLRERALDAQETAEWWEGEADRREQTGVWSWDTVRRCRDRARAFHAKADRLAALAGAR